MVLLAITLALVIGVGLVTFKAQVIDQADTAPSSGCAGVVLLVAAFFFVLTLVVRVFGQNPRTLLFVVIPIGAVFAVLYSPFVAGVFASFFDRVIFPGGGGEVKTHDIAEKLVTEKRYAEAIAEYERVLEEDPDDVDARLSLAETHSKAGEHVQAAQILLEALEHDLPSEKWCHVANRLADILLQKLGKPTEAIEILRRIEKKCPRTKFAQYAQERIARITEC